MFWTPKLFSCLFVPFVDNLNLRVQLIICSAIIAYHYAAHSATSQIKP